MKLSALSMVIDDPHQTVKVIDRKSRRVCFEGRTDDLCEYSGFDARKVTGVYADAGILVIVTNP